MRLMLRELFRASGHEVSMAADGVEALAFGSMRLQTTASVA